MNIDGKKNWYKELPYPWTIGRKGGGPFHEDVFFGLNTQTGEKTEDYATYGLALRAVEHREVLAIGEKKKRGVE